MENEVDKFLEGIEGNEKNDDPFQPESKDPFATDVVTEKKGEEVEKLLPFNKDPKVQRFIEKEISKRLAEHKPTEVIREVEKVESVDSITDVLTRIVGNDTPEKVAAVKDLRRELEGLSTKAREEALRGVQKAAEDEREEERKASEQLDNSFEDIEEQYGVDLTSGKPEARKVRADFVDFIKRISPKNEDGEVTEFPDLVQSFEVFKSIQKAPTNNRAKELASRGMTRSSDASKVPQTGGQSWRDVDKIFSNLKN